MSVILPKFGSIKWSIHFLWKRCFSWAKIRFIAKRYLVFLNAVSIHRVSVEGSEIDLLVSLVC